jgi:ferredoxin
MRVVLDQTRCAAHGDCVVAAPKVFDLDDDDDFARVIDENPPQDLRSEVEMAVRVCPVSAISLED